MFTLSLTLNIKTLYLPLNHNTISHGNIQGINSFRQKEDGRDV